MVRVLIVEIEHVTDQHFHREMFLFGRWKEKQNLFHSKYHYQPKVRRWNKTI